MDFGQTFWVQVLALLVVALVTAIAAGTWRWVATALGKRPDFRLEWTVNNNWKIYRTKRRTAFDVKWGGGNIEASDISVFRAIGSQGGFDLGRGDQTNISLDAPGLYYLTWIDQRRKYSKAMNLDGSVKEFAVVAVKPRKDGKIYT